MVQSYQLARDTAATTSGILTKRIRAREGLRRLIKEFYENLDGEIPDLINVENALETNRILCQIWESAEASQEHELSAKQRRLFSKRYGFARQIRKKDKRSRILVTGGSGFLGHHLAMELAKKDCIVRLLGRKLEKRFEAFDNVEILYGDIRNEECVDKAVQGVNTIYHCAAVASNRGTWERFKQTNVDGTWNLLKSASKYNVNRFVFVSSVAVYGFNKRKNGQLVNETDGAGEYFSPYCYYAKSKVEAEQLVMTYHREEGLPSVILRPGVIFGPGKGNLFGENRVVFGAKNRVLPYIYVKNVVDAMILAGEVESAAGETYNVVGDEQPSTGEFRRRIETTSGKTRRSLFVPISAMWAGAHAFETLANRRKSQTSPVFGLYHFHSLVRDLLYDNSKIKNQLGWRSEISIEDGIKETLRTNRD
jgi:nucleoside-diphosphate-sugar epimerase